MAEDDEMNEGFWKAITKYGLGTVGFVVLMYVFLGELRQDQKALHVGQAIQRGEHAVAAGDRAKLIEMALAAVVADARVLRVLQVSCVNQARTETQRRDCLNIP